jgi:hypothetical protein
VTNDLVLEGSKTPVNERIEICLRGLRYCNILGYLKRRLAAGCRDLLCRKEENQARGPPFAVHEWKSLIIIGQIIFLAM